LTKQCRDGDRQCGKTDASKDSTALLGQHGQATGHWEGLSHTQRHVNLADKGGFESNHVSDNGAGTGRQSNWRAYNATKRRGQGIINKDHQVAPKQMPLGARLAVNTHKMGWYFVESVKNARCQ